jgi:hypothetical protein
MKICYLCDGPVARKFTGVVRGSYFYWQRRCLRCGRVEDWGAWDREWLFRLHVLLFGIWRQ